MHTHPIHELLIVDKYKYLGVILDELLTMQTCIETLSDSGSRAMGGIITKFKMLKSEVVPILDYGAFGVAIR